MFLSWHACYIVRGGALGICQGGATCITILWHCMWGRGPRRNNVSGLFFFFSIGYFWILGLPLLPSYPLQRWKQFSFPPTVYESTYYVLLILVSFWIIDSLMGEKGIFIAVFICISLIMNEIKNLFIYLMAIYISFPEKCLLLFLPDFLRVFHPLPIDLYKVGANKRT